MTTRAVAAERVAWAAGRLLACRSTSAVVAEAAERWGISRRQAQRIVGAAHAVVAADLEAAGVDRRQLVAQVHHGLMEAMAKALASDQPAAVVGAARELRELFKLATAPSPLARDRDPWMR